VTEASLAKSTNLRQSSFVAAAEIGLVVENAPHQTAAVPGGGMAGEGRRSDETKETAATA